MSHRGAIAGGGFLLLAGLVIALHLQSSAPQRFIVNKGASAHEIARELKQNGLVWHPWTFLAWVHLRGRHAIRPGAYSLSPRMTGFQIYNAFRQGPPIIRITFPEGWTAKQMAALLESHVITGAGPFLNLVQIQQREGFLFPDTYFFEQGIDPSQVIDRMVHRFHEKEPRDLQSQAQAMKLSYRQLVTLASLVEKEARAPEERPLIAGVYLNRLRKHMLLEADPTVQYALGEWKSKLHYKDLQIESPYNTYRHLGLPPGPICNPGAASLAAAAHPMHTDNLFFVATSSGTHIFTKTYQQHMAVQRAASQERRARKAASQ